MSIAGPLGKGERSDPAGYQKHLILQFHPAIYDRIQWADLLWNPNCMFYEEIYNFCLNKKPKGIPMIKQPHLDS